MIYTILRPICEGTTKAIIIIIIIAGSIFTKHQGTENIIVLVNYEI